MIKNIALVFLSVMFTAYVVERSYYINQIEDQLIGALVKVDVADSLMTVNTM